MVANVHEELTNAIGGVYTFKIHGSIYHEIVPFQNHPREQPKFAQIYIYDLEAQLHWQQSIFDGLDIEVL